MIRKKHFLEDGNISITLTEYREEDTSIYVADIVLSPCDLKTAFAQKQLRKKCNRKNLRVAEGVNAHARDEKEIITVHRNSYLLVLLS